ncbi:MAG: M6 family metalloprotease domain-containing protein [Gemmatimonadetes bacterium]|nr:M6 family metalloprotease domain-containing protein [Gemmatimonadota bacterium]
MGRWCGSAALVVLAVAAFTQAAVGQRPERPLRELRVTPFGVVLDFHRDGAWRVRARRVVGQRAALRAARDFAGLNAAVSGVPAGVLAAVVGTMHVPAILFRYQDIGFGASRDTSEYSAVLFAAAPTAGRPYTIRTFYEQLSSNLVSVQGNVLGWYSLPGDEAQFTGTPGTCSGNPFGTNNCNGIFSGTAFTALNNGLRQLLAVADLQVDFGLFDSDGPDDIPNSGDDDGIVDMVLFVHSEQDGACGGATNNHVWAHKSSSLSGAFSNDLSANGGFIAFRDYIIQSGVGGSSGCDSTQVMPIGTTAHETGHAFGLPDLYDVSGDTEGIGRWGLMGSGNWSTQPSPARMVAWSLDRLGWITVAPLDADGSYTFGPAGVADTAFFIYMQGNNPRGEYFLVENRQPVQSDSAVIRRACDVSGLAFPGNCGGGLAIWHIDSTKIASGGGVNVGPIHGVAMVQADGLNQLRATSGGNRGDGGDLYPGATGNTALSLTSNPASAKNADGSFAGVVIDSIAQVVPNGEMSFRLSFGLPLTVTASGPGTVLTDAGDTAIGTSVKAVGDTVVLIAVPDVGAILDRWAGDESGNDDTLAVAMTRSVTITAVFAATLVTDTTPPPPAVMGAPYSHTFSATGGIGSVFWTVATGQLPEGLGLASGGTLSGIPAVTGQFAVTARATSGSQVADLAVSLEVTAPALSRESVLGQLLGTGAELSTDQLTYLDLLGNRNGGYDVGDFLAWVEVSGATVDTDTMGRIISGRAGR